MNSNGIRVARNHLSLVYDEFKLAPHGDAPECTVSGGCSSVDQRGSSLFLPLSISIWPDANTPKTDIIPLERIVYHGEVSAEEPLGSTVLIVVRQLSFAELLYIPSLCPRCGCRI